MSAVASSNPPPIDDEPTDPGSFKSGAVCEAGRVYAVDFEVLALVASGGMGEVYRVRHRQTGRLHAMKVMRPELVRNSALVERFEKEGAALTRFKHRGVVRAEQVGYDREIGPYIIMELLEGMTLSDLMMRFGRPLPPDQGIPILIEVATALDLVHQRGILHRDIKPQNIFLHKADGQPRETKVLDFGAMKAHSKSLHFSSTDASKTIGTPRYMAPEQLVAQALGAYTDVYALGLVAYEILSYASIFGPQAEHASLDEIRMFHLFAERVALGRVVPTMPPSVWEAIERATRRDVATRTPTMQIFVEDLKRAMREVMAKRDPDSEDNITLDELRARIAAAQAQEARQNAPKGAPPEGPHRATAYGLHLVDLGPPDSEEHVVFDVEAAMRDRRDLTAKLAAYHEAQARMGTLPPLDPREIRRLLEQLDARIAAAMPVRGTGAGSPSPPPVDELAVTAPSVLQPAPQVVALSPAVPPTATAAAPAVAAAAQLGHLIGVSGPGVGCDMHIGAVGLRIGRETSCQLQLRDDGVSELHATITRMSDGGFEIVDADSTNGTRVNGQRVPRAVLQVGDRIAIGDSVFAFRLADTARSGRRRTVRKPDDAAARGVPAQLAAPPGMGAQALLPTSSPAVSRNVPVMVAPRSERTYFLASALGSAVVVAVLVYFFIFLPRSGTLSAPLRTNAPMQTMKKLDAARFAVAYAPTASAPATPTPSASARVSPPTPRGRP